MELLPKQGAYKTELVEQCLIIFLDIQCPFLSSSLWKSPVVYDPNVEGLVLKTPFCSGMFDGQPRVEHSSHVEIPEAASPALQLPLQKGGAGKHHSCAAVNQDTSDRARRAHWSNCITHLVLILRMLICFWEAQVNRLTTLLDLSIFML